MIDEERMAVYPIDYWEAQCTKALQIHASSIAAERAEAEYIFFCAAKDYVPALVDLVRRQRERIRELEGAAEEER